MTLSIETTEPAAGRPHYLFTAAHLAGVLIPAHYTTGGTGDGSSLPRSIKKIEVNIMDFEISTMVCIVAWLLVWTLAAIILFMPKVVGEIGE